MQVMVNGEAKEIDLSSLERITLEEYGRRYQPIFVEAVGLLDEAGKSDMADDLARAANELCSCLYEREAAQGAKQGAGCKIGCNSPQSAQ